MVATCLGINAGSSLMHAAAEKARAADNEAGLHNPPTEEPITQVFSLDLKEGVLRERIASKSMMLCASSNPTLDDPRRAWPVRAPLSLARLSPALFLALNGALLNSQAAEVNAASAATGPTIRLDYASGKPTGSSVASFMYFVPLISPEPVSSLTSPGSTQSIQLFSATRRSTANSFFATCEFEISGEGSHQSQFDLSEEIRRHERKLKEGGSMRRQLNCITVNGKGSGAVEVEGTVSNGVQMITEVRLRFNAHGKASPVSIGLCDIRYVDGEFRHLKEMVAQVNTLTFRRQPGPPKMEVTVASVKKKGAGNSLWQSIKGSISGTAVNLLIDPLTVKRIGHQAMLDFGHALVAGAPTFTFPHAKNLKDVVAGQP
jgi:hypothetical protein